MKRITIDFLVGLFILLGILSIAFLSLKVASVGLEINNNKSYTIYAKFNNIGSLKISAPIKISGIVIGRITNINLDDKSYQAIVTMSINGDYHFSIDSSAQILTTGLLGEQYISILPGADDLQIKNGGTITMTSSAMVLEDLIGKFMTNIK